MHLKRQMIGKFWPVPRKGTKFLAVASHEKEKAIPLVVVLRDILRIIDNKKELKKIINEKRILVNNKIIKETNFPVLLFDVISFPNIKKYYRSVFSKRKIVFEEISEEKSFFKAYKVERKKILKGKKIQINLSDGRNLLSKQNINPGDSVLFNFKDKKIEKVLKSKKDAVVVVLKGKYIGSYGKIREICEKKFVKIELKDKEVDVDKKNIMVVE